MTCHTSHCAVQRQTSGVVPQCVKRLVNRRRAACRATHHVGESQTGTASAIGRVERNIGTGVRRCSSFPSTERRRRARRQKSRARCRVNDDQCAPLLLVPFRPSCPVPFLSFFCMLLTNARSLCAVLYACCVGIVANTHLFLLYRYIGAGLLSKLS